MMVGIVERRVPEREDRIADVLVERGAPGEQDVAHRGQELDQEIDHLPGRKLLGDPRESADVAHQHGHVPLFAAELELARVGRDLADHFRREITVEGRVDVAALALLAIEYRHRLHRVDRGQRQHRIRRVEQVAHPREGQPASRRDGADAEQRRERALGSAEPRKQQRQRASHEGREQQFQRKGPIRPLEKVAGEDLLRRGGVHRDPGHSPFDRRGNEILQSRRAAADEHDPVSHRARQDLVRDATADDRPGRKHGP